MWYTSFNTQDEVVAAACWFLLASMISDCFKYYKGCEACQKFDNIQLAPATMLHPIIKLWPFRGWGLDFIGQIHPPSSKGHWSVLVAIVYFTKWYKAVPLKNLIHVEVFRFITDYP